MRVSCLGCFVLSCFLAGTLCGCQSLSEDVDHVLSERARVEEENRRAYEAAVREYEEYMPRSVAFGAEICDAVYDGEPPVNYDDFLARVGHVRGDRESLVRVGDAMDAAFFVASENSMPDFRAVGLSSVVHSALFAVEGLCVDGSFDWSATDASSQVREVYDSVRSMHSSADELASKLVLFQRLAADAGLDESSYAGVVARDDAVVDVCVAEIERICAEHGIGLV